MADRHSYHLAAADVRSELRDTLTRWAAVRRLAEAVALCADEASDQLTAALARVDVELN